MIHRRDKSCRLARNRGLTLLELLVVIAILALLASLLAVNYRGTLSNAKHKIADQEMLKFKNLLDQYYFEQGSFPSQSEGLAALTHPLPGHSEPLATGKLNDPWGHDYIYVCPGNHGKYDLICFGADGVEGGDGENADIVSWDVSSNTNDQLK